MAKKSYNNYDDTLFGQYIRQIENADSAGWNASDRIWRAPQRKGLDKRNRGMGVDVLNNLDTKALTKNRPGQYLTEKEEHQLRNEHIQYLLDVINKRKEEDNPALKSMSPKKQAQVLGIMYRGDAPELWKENTILGKALISNKDEDMDKAIKDFYESKRLGERAKNDSIFWNNQKMQNKSKAAAVPQPHINNTVEYQDAIKTYRPAVMPSQIKRDTKKAMQDKVDFHNFMDSISIQNNLPPAYTPKSNIHSEGGFMYEPRDAWKALPLSEKAEMMKVAVRNGITNLQDIRQKYNEFAEGGNIYKEGGKKKSSSANPSAQRAMRYFMDKGLTDYQAAGLVGNLMRESGMNPQALNKGSKAYGLAQWLGPRKKALFAKYGNNPSLENQLDFIWSELNSTHKNGLRHLRSSKSAEEAARNAMGYYEFSAGPEAAIANMRKYGQDGEGSMRKGISFASSLMGQPISAYNPRQNEATQLSLQESTIPSEGFIYTPLNPQVFGIADTPSYTINVPDQTLTSDPQIEESSVSLYSPEELDRQERMDRLSAFNNMLRMTSPQGGGNVFLDAIGMLTGNAFAEGGDTNDNDLVDWIIREEGFNKKPEDIGDGKITLGSGLTDPKWHALYKKRGNKWSEADNRMAVAEEVANRRKWAEKNIPNWDTLPDSAQKALLSYKYNYNFTSANSPKLFQALADSNLYEAAKQMDATSKDPKFKKGLMDRRKREQEWFLSDVTGNATPTQAIPVQTPTTIGISMPSITEPAVSTAVRNNYVPATTTPYNRGSNMRRAFESAVAFNRMMNATSLQNNSLPEYQFPISYAEGGYTNPGMTGMMKSKLATAAHFGNPTARRITNYDARSYTWPGEYEYDNGIGELKRGNVFVGSYDNLVTPQIQDDGKDLIFVDDVWAPENDQRSYMQSLKFNNDEDARYFGDHYKEIAPMMSLYSNGGKIHIKPSHRGRLTELKKRTGKSEAELYKTGGPAVRKMITFARNARKWKHELGGNLLE